MSPTSPAILLIVILSNLISRAALPNVVRCTVVKRCLDSEEGSHKLARASVNRLVSVKSDE